MFRQRLPSLSTLIILCWFDTTIAGAASLSQALIDTSELSSHLYYFQRQRERRDETGNNDRYLDDLDHGTGQWAFDYRSGLVAERWQLQLAGFVAEDLVYDEQLPRNIENEFSFAGPRWSREYSDQAQGGGSISRAQLGYHSDDSGWQLEAGWLPLQLPGLIGVNWSFQPGSYRGFKLQWQPDSSHWRFSYAWADLYKAPWYKELQHFSKVNAWDPDPVSPTNRIDYIHGLAGQYQPPQSRGYAQFSLGQSEGYLDSTHAKIGYRWPLLDGLDLSYLLYTADSSSDSAPLYQGLAWQQGVKAQLNHGRWTWRTELLATKAEGLGAYLPRLTRGYGNSQGDLEIWWNSRSDWNHDGETALFVGSWYRFPQRSLGSWQLGLSAAYGRGARRWIDQQLDHSAPRGSERAWNLDLGYKVEQGRWQGLECKLHYTDYRNDQDHLGSFYYANMFTSERDLKLQLILPLAL